MKPIVFTAWAIKTEGERYLGRYWHFMGKRWDVPAHLEGCQIALFVTRAEARGSLQWERQEAYQPFPHARVEQVRVTIERIDTEALNE